MGAKVSVYTSSDNKPVRTFAPFGNNERGLSTAVGDVDGDAIPDKQVAAELFLSQKTVEHHLSRVYAKLGLRSRTELAVTLGAAQRGRSL